MSNFHNEHVMAWYRQRWVSYLAECMAGKDERFLELQSSIEVWREQYMLQPRKPEGRPDHEIFPCPPEYE